MTRIDSDPAAPRPAATILLVRDAPELQVLMLKRHPGARVGADHLVFPGGTVDASDGDLAWADDVVGFEACGADRALRICALRELYEESAILLARSRCDGDWRISPHAAGAREAVLKGELSFRDLVRRLGLVLDLAGLTPFARWITPEHIDARFDATFFVVTAPDDQLAACDGYETVTAEWGAPRQILLAQARGDCKLMLPTRLNLQLLDASRTASKALSDARARTVRPVQPRLERRADGAVMVVPETDGYGVVEERV